MLGGEATCAQYGLAIEEYGGAVILQDPPEREEERQNGPKLPQQRAEPAFKPVHVVDLARY